MTTKVYYYRVSADGTRTDGEMQLPLAARYAVASELSKIAKGRKLTEADVTRAMVRSLSDVTGNNWKDSGFHHPSTWWYNGIDRMRFWLGWS